MFESKLEGTGKVGKSRLRWLEDVESDLEETDRKKWSQQTRSREEWISLIMEATIFRWPQNQVSKQAPNWDAVEKLGTPIFCWAINILRATNFETVSKDFFFRILVTTAAFMKRKRRQEATVRLFRVTQKRNRLCFHSVTGLLFREIERLCFALQPTIGTKLYSVDFTARVES